MASTANTVERTTNRDRAMAQCVCLSGLARLKIFNIRRAKKASGCVDSAEGWRDGIALRRPSMRPALLKLRAELLEQDFRGTIASEGITGNL